MAALDAGTRQSKLDISTSEPVIDKADILARDRAIPDSNLKADEGEAAKATVGDEGDDVRTLRVVYDSQGERFRDCRQTAQDSTSPRFADWPHSGPPSLLCCLKHFCKHGGEPKSWFQTWLRRHSLDGRD